LTQVISILENKDKNPDFSGFLSLGKGWVDLPGGLSIREVFTINFTGPFRAWNSWNVVLDILIASYPCLTSRYNLDDHNMYLFFRQYQLILSGLDVFFARMVRFDNGF